MTEPENFTHRLLREMRAEMTGQFEELRTEIGGLRDEVRENTKRMESLKQAAFGESVLGRYAAAEVEERLERIEKRLETLEGRS
jgi:chaperonin cofactor prefoldin